MAGSLIHTSEPIVGQERDTKHTLVWTSDGSGNVSGNNINLSPGGVIAVTFVPGSGADQPTDLYDVTLLCVEDNDFNILNGEGANLSSVNAVHVALFKASSGGVSYEPFWFHGGELELVVAGAGATNKGTIKIYMAHGRVL